MEIHILVVQNDMAVDSKQQEPYLPSRWAITAKKAPPMLPPIKHEGVTLEMNMHTVIRVAIAMIIRLLLLLTNNSPMRHSLPGQFYTICSVLSHTIVFYHVVSTMALLSSNKDLSINCD